VPLTDNGHIQAQLLAERLQHERIHALYCSPQLRAIQTATPIATLLGLEIQQRSQLREMNFGDWEGRLKADLAKEYPDELDLWERGSLQAHLPGGETLDEVIARSSHCFTDILANSRGQTVLVVAHKTLLRLLIGHLLEMTLPASRRLMLEPASLSELHISQAKAQLIYYNDVRHLTK
jgi:broad specificity phosphatase PhoE